MANIYYSDTLGSNLNVFEKKAKSGEPFYYIYLNKNKITESDVGKLTKIMQDTLPQAKIKTKKGKIAYQITWSYNTPMPMWTSPPLVSEKKLFDAMFNWLQGYGYVDDYQPKATKKSTSKSTQATTTTTSNVVDDIKIPNKVLKIGDEFYFNSEIKKKTNKENPLFKIIDIQDDNVSVSWTNEDGKLRSLDNWVSTKEAQQYVENGTITFPNNSGVTTPTQSTTNDLRSKFSVFSLLKFFENGTISRIIRVEQKGNTLEDDDQIVVQQYFETFGTVEERSYNVKTIEWMIGKGDIDFIGRVQKGDIFYSKLTDGKREVVDVKEFTSPFGNDISFNTNKNIGNKFSPSNVLTEDTFTYRLVESRYILESREVSSSKPSTPSASITQKAQIDSSEINALKKELSDLIFLKSNTSDLDFEDKINISTEISDVQKKIDDLNEKLFEQSVGDEQFFDKLFEQSFTPLKDRYDLIITPNTLPEILSPSGEMSDLNEDIQVLINSKEFKEWFGDWRNAFFYRNLDDFGGLNVSKVLNDKFEPLLVWHGTNNEFSYFDFEMFPANYFAVNKEYSEFFAINKGGRGYVLPFFLNIKNPLDLSDFGIERVSSKDFFDWMYLATGMNPNELEVNPMFLDDNLEDLPIWMYIRNNPTMLKKIADAKVYDGIKFYEYNPNEENNPDRRAFETLAYVVFDPHQVKLADPSRGEILLASLKSFMLKKGGKI